MKRRITLAIAIGSVVALTSGCAAGGSGGTAQYAHPNDSTTWLANADKEWVADVASATDGDVEVDIQWAGSLAGAAEAADAMSSGVSQIGILFPSYTPAKFPTTTWLSELAFLADERPVIGDMQSFAATLEVSLNSDLIMDEYRNQGIEPLLPMFEMNTGYYLACTKPVTSLDAAKGKTVRTAGGPWERETEALGMAPTQLGITEVYEALQRGVLDCSTNPLRDFVSFDLTEVATEITMDDETGFSGFTAALGANDDWWNEQDPEVQDQIWKTLKDYSGRFVASGVSGDFEIREKVEKQDVTIHEMDSDMSKALKKNQRQRLDNAVDSAPKGSKEQYEKLLKEYSKAMDKWEGIISDELGYGDTIPPTWSKFFDSGKTIDDIDFEPFADRLWDEVLEPATPSSR